MGLFDSLKNAILGDAQNHSDQPKAKRRKRKKKEYQPPAAGDTIIIEYLNYAGDLKQFIGDPKSIRRRGNHFSVRVAPTFKRNKTPLLYATNYEGGACGRYVFCFNTVPNQELAKLLPHMNKTF